MNTRLLPFALVPSLFSLLSACGGGGSDQQEVATAADSTTASTETPTARDAALRPAIKLPGKPGSPKTPTPPPMSNPPPSTGGPASAISDSTRIAAATATAQSTTNLCGPIKPFYWEIGTGAGKVASGSVTSPTIATKYSSTSPLSIASASKWIYGAYVAQKTNGVLSAQDIQFLTFRSGYTNYSKCLQTQTVDQCLAYQGNGLYVANTAGKFDYGGGHMEKHASLNGLGAMNNQMLASTVMAQIGSDVKIGYSQPMLAGGIYTTAHSYAIFLRKIIGKQLKISGLLSADPVCTNRVTCPAEAIQAPIPASETWHYSIGHWIEDDPVVGDGAFSSPGAFGFYPWIDATRTYYGVLARDASQGGVPSMQCGRLIRKAWVTGTAM